MPIRLPTLLSGFALLCASAFPQSKPEVRFNLGRGGIMDLLGTGKGLLAVSQSGYILASPDGETWTARDSGDVYWRSVCLSGTGRYLANSAVSHAVSQDGSQWKKGRNDWGIEVADALGTRTVGLTAGHIYLSSTDTTWERVGADSQGSSPNLNSIIALASNGKVAVGVGNHSLVLSVVRTGLSAVSTDGETWTFREAPDFGAFYDVAWAKDRFFAASTGSLASSTDGLSWTRLSVPANAIIRDVAWTGKQFVAVGARIILVSADGNAWRSVPVQDTLVNYTKVAWTGSRLVLAGIRASAPYIATAEEDPIPVRPGAGAAPGFAYAIGDGRLNVRLPASERAMGAHLLDLRGMAVRTGAFLPSPGGISLPVAGLGRGTYVLRVDGERATYAAPVLIPR